MNRLNRIVKKDGRDIDGDLQCLFLLDHAIIAANRIGFQTVHRAALIEDKDEIHALCRFPLIAFAPCSDIAYRCLIHLHGGVLDRLSLCIRKRQGNDRNCQDSKNG